MREICSSKKRRGLTGTPIPGLKGTFATPDNATDEASKVYTISARANAPKTTGVLAVGLDSDIRRSSASGRAVDDLGSVPNYASIQSCSPVNCVRPRSHTIHSRPFGG